MIKEVVVKSNAGDKIAKASATVETDGVTLTLEGVFFLEGAAALEKFFGDLKDLRHAGRWTLRLEQLDVISERGLRVLAKFVRSIRRRGGAVAIAGIHPAVRAQLQAMPRLRKKKSRDAGFTKARPDDDARR